MDRILRFLTKSGSLAATVMDSTYMVATAQQIHQCSPVATAALGRLMTGAAMLGSQKAQGTTVQVKVAGDGPLGTLLAIADSRGNCRASIQHPKTTLPLRGDGKLDVGAAVGHHGLLGVMYEYGQRSPYASQVALVSGEIAEDFTSYFAVSEQTPTVCALGVLVGTQDAAQVLSGGLLVQALPGALDEEISVLEQNAKAMPPVTKLLSNGEQPEDIVARVFHGIPFETVWEKQPHYVCTCNRARVARAFATLQPAELRHLADEHSGYAEAVCQYCGRHYRFSAQELEAMAQRAKAPSV